MAEAYKCDVVNCDKFSEGSPAGRFTAKGQAKGMCEPHTASLITSFFPDMEAKPEPEPAPAPEVSTTPAEATPEAAPVETPAVDPAA